ncbi:hypothetical protein GH714_019716 [Hevea brasiliensis]|uniref:Uncharacterized protein n=1 Tax=Hevea brasiliensis TaxID=3981 RepID=A0A6A6LKJ4_HEVBR|nr:hypothetical protein GH714_019716 [Hevea brasiliensis]
MSEEGPKLYATNKKAQLKQFREQQKAKDFSSPTPTNTKATPTPFSSALDAAASYRMASQSTAPHPPPPQPPKESFSRRYNLNLALLNVIRVLKFKKYPCWTDVNGHDMGCVSTALNMPIGASFSLPEQMSAYDSELVFVYEVIMMEATELPFACLQLTNQAYLFMRTKKKDTDLEEEVATNVSTPPTASPLPEKPISLPTIAETVKLHEPIPENQQRELYKWILEEKRKVKPKDPQEKRRVDEDKAILKQFIRAKSIPSI